tara:strand:+ start:1402 stop:1764 length:363 start_codon:yes stop_codon:yes gene_type:complete
METTVKVKHLRQSSSKIRFVLKEVNGLKVDFALEKLEHTNKKASNFILKAIKSGISNLSASSDNIDLNKIYVSNAFVNEGPTIKRFRPAAMGRAMPIRKRTSHLIITLSDKKRSTLGTKS